MKVYVSDTSTKPGSPEVQAKVDLKGVLDTMLTAPGAWRAVVWLLMALGVSAIALSVIMGERARRALPVAAGLAGALLMARATGPTAVWRHSPIGVGRVEAEATSSPAALRAWMNNERRSIRWEADGVESSVALGNSEGWAFVVNGKIDGSARGDAATQVMGGLVGGILHPSPKSALVIGLGTGSTAGWLGAVPAIDRVDVVELEPVIRAVAGACRSVNRDVLQNPKVHITIGDAREVLLTSRRTYDIIFSEPSNPYRAGVASLFTREYYEAIESRLSRRRTFSTVAPGLQRRWSGGADHLRHARFDLSRHRHLGARYERSLAGRVAQAGRLRRGQAARAHRGRALPERARVCLARRRSRGSARSFRGKLAIRAAHRRRRARASQRRRPGARRIRFRADVGRQRSVERQGHSQTGTAEERTSAAGASGHRRLEPSRGKLGELSRRGGRNGRSS